MSCLCAETQAASRECGRAVSPNPNAQNVTSAAGKLIPPSQTNARAKPRSERAFNRPIATPRPYIHSTLHAETVIQIKRRSPVAGCAGVQIIIFAVQLAVWVAPSSSAATLFDAGVSTFVHNPNYRMNACRKRGAGNLQLSSRRASHLVSVWVSCGVVIKFLHTQLAESIVCRHDFLLEFLA